jgi:hypothetical protein
MNYRKAFFVTVVVAIALAVALVYYVRQPRAMPSQPRSGNPSKPNLRPLLAQQAPQRTETATPKLSPVQLSPERLQSIGVKFAEVKHQSVQDEIRVTGNVDVNEEDSRICRRDSQDEFKRSLQMRRTSMSAKDSRYSRSTAKSL